MSAPATQEHLGRIARGGAVGMAGAVFSAASSFALVVIVTRGFTPGEAGLFFAVTSVFLVLAAASSLGSDTGLARFLQRYEAQGRHDDVRRAVRAAAVPALVVSTFSALVLVVGAGPVSGALGLEERGESLLRWLALALPFAVAADLALAVTRAFGRMRISVLVDRFLRAGLQPPLALVVVLAGGTLLAAAGAWAAAYVVSAAVALVASRRYLRTRLTRHRTDGPVPVRERVDGLPMAGAGTPLSVRREFWGFTWPRGVARLAQITVQKADIVIVAALLSPAHAAVYTAATRFVALGQFATHAIQQVLQPRLTAILIHDDQDTLRQVFRIATTWSILLAWPLYLVVGTAPLVYLSVFGDQYAAAAEDASGVAVVAVMAVAMLVSVAAGPLDTVLLMAGRSRASLGNALTAMTVDLVLCFLLIPVVGLVGAALAWGAAVLARTALTLVQVRRHLGVTPGGRPVIVASVLPVVCLAVPVATHSLLGAGTLGGFALVLGVGAVAYLGALFVFRRLLGLDLLVQAVVPLRLRRWVYDVLPWRFGTVAVPLDRLLLGGQNRLGATAFAEAVGDDSWPLTRVVDGPHVDLLLACAERELSDEEILRSRYGQMALACISSGGQFFSATDGPGVVAIARRFVAHTRRGMQSAPGDTAVPHQSRPGHPALVVPVRGTDCFQLIDGHHRVAGLWVLGQREVEAKVKRLPVALPRRAPEPVTGSRATSRAS